MVFLCEQVIEKLWIETYLRMRGIGNQYKKVKKYLLEWNFKAIDFRKREPKQDDIYYFKISNKYRGWWYMEWSTFVVFKIDDHQ